MSQASTDPNSHHNAPPGIQPVNTIELISVKQSRIAAVNLYFGRAEVTRVFNFELQVGQNDVTIIGLPFALDQDSIRVEGQGPATIHGVSVSRIPSDTTIPESPLLRELNKKKYLAKKTLKRYNTALSFLEKSLATFSLQDGNISKLTSIVDGYNTESRMLDEDNYGLEEEIRQLGLDAAAEALRLEPGYKYPLNLQAKIGIFADVASKIDLVLTYAVNSATWIPGFDIRVNTNTKESQISLTYKASLSQSTGEDWENVPLTLQTATPTYGVDIPKLHPWRLAIYEPTQVPGVNMPAPPIIIQHDRHHRRSPQRRGAGPVTVTTSRSSRPLSRSSRSLSRSSGSRWRRSRSRSSSRSRRSPHTRYEPPPPPPQITHRGGDVSSSSGIVATFRIPGVVSIPSDREQHSVTIAQLELDAVLSWIVVPKLDTRAHLQASIKNTSPYTFLPAQASVYVDGSFIAKSPVPAVSPQESFECPLGIDPSIRVEYHPRSKKVSSKSGFLSNSKTTTHEFIQRITLFNSKSILIPKISVTDQIPVSQDTRILVKLITPPLNNLIGTGVKSPLKAKGPTSVSEGVKAQWVGSEDDSDAESAPANKDGKLNWICAIPPQGKINLTLQWEVTAPVGMSVSGW